MKTRFTTPGSERPHLGEALELMRRLWALNHEIERLSGRMSRALGITAQQRMMLRIIGRFPGISSGRLSELLCVDAATVSTGLVRLEKRGLLRRQRDPRDGRRVSVALTQDGRALDVPTTGTVEAAVQRALAGCGSSERQAMVLVLDALTLALVDETPVATPSALAPRARDIGATRGVPGRRSRRLE